VADRRLGPLLPGYVAPAGHFDELLDDQRHPRSHWEEFAAHAGELGRDQLTHGQTRVDRQIHENGVTYNVYADVDGPARPWTLDVLPFIVPAQEWESLATGLAQRARLLNALAADLYGEQALLTEGLVPSSLIFRHPGFLRECHGVRPPGNRFVHLAAFDLARRPDGRWCVIGTRAQAPSGAGYALENRAVISRLFPDAFRALRVQALAGFFQTLQSTMLADAPVDGETPHLVLLTPGPYNETYFEHAFLAKQLGFPLVEGGDLTVRHDKLFLKTVAGLRRVHGVLRRMDDDYCDPLELRSDSTLGVSGLVQAWRAGSVLIANAFGTGVLESPALHAFLPAACERLLGERLITPSLETAWCGDAEGMSDIHLSLSDGVIKPACPGSSMEPVFLGDLDPAVRESWIARLDADPDSYVLEEFLPLSHAPVWHDRALTSRALMLRVFLVVDSRGHYRMMPGGLARIAGDNDRHIVSGQRGGGSKDTWVLSEAPLESTLPSDARTPARDEVRATESMTSSRAAEHLFWLGRYAERSENCARLLRTVLTRLTDPDAFAGSLPALAVRTCREQGLLGAGEPLDMTGDRAPAVLERALLDGLLDARTHHSLAFNIKQTVQAAGAVRHRLSSDNWRLLNRLHELMAGIAPTGIALDDALEVVDQAIVSLVAVGGLEMAHMTRDHGWRFLSIGRHLERLSFVASTLDDVASVGLPADAALLEWLLDLSDSLITYRARHRHYPEWAGVVDLLLFDGHNPRSGCFQLAKLAKHVQLLPDADPGDLAGVLDDVERWLAVCGPVDRTQGELFGARPPLGEVLVSCQRLALRLSDALTLRYFSHIYERPEATRTI
jgi:uncharacterized circularly permuted ATP-grasp superfamily protein/uncharacterized alpha-E superfamily protein